MKRGAKRMTAKSYDDIAEWYADWVSVVQVQDDSFFRSVNALLGTVGHFRICDLACGEGRVSRYLASQGAYVVGVDVSEKLLAIAAAKEKSEVGSVTYMLDDAQKLGSLVDSSFDGVVCNMALMDIPDLASTLNAVRRVLRDRGWFVFSILHPCYHTPTSDEQTRPDGRLERAVSGYWNEGYWRSETRVGPPGKIGAYHRTLATYVNALVDYGLVIERILEPQASGRRAQSRPIWTEVPAGLIMRCVKSS
jgi:ubiquinone/menaquinone biosynthesis C-methylase UbiE